MSKDRYHANLWYFQSSPIVADPASCSIDIPQAKIVRIDCINNATLARSLGTGYSTKIEADSANSDWPPKSRVQIGLLEVTTERADTTFQGRSFYFSESYKATTPTPVIDRDWMWTVESSKLPRPSLPATLVATTFTLQTYNQWIRLDCWDVPGNLRDKSIKLAQKLGFYKAIANVYENRH